MPQIEFVDMHFGTGPAAVQQLDERDPHVVADHLREIEVCSNVSKSVFFIVSCSQFAYVFVFVARFGVACIARV